MRTQDFEILEEDFICMRFKNDSDNVQVMQRDTTSGIMQFHFLLKGEGTFVFNEGTYSLNVKEENGLTLYNPQRSLPIHLEVRPNTWVISIIISIKKFHSLFSTEAEFIPFLDRKSTRLNSSHVRIS